MSTRVQELGVFGDDADDAVVLAVPYRQVRHDVLVPLVAVERHGEQAVAVWADVGPSSLPRSLSAQQVVTVGRAAGGALASLHAHGLVHGDVTADALVRDADGAPRLAGAGAAVWCGRPSSPADDVHGLALVLAHLLASDASPDAEAVRAALSPALASHPAARPVASQLVAALGAAAPPAPLPRPARPAPPARSRSAMWRPRAPLRGHIPDVGPAVGAGVVALAVALAVLLATHPWSTSALRRPQARSGPHISDVDRWGATVRAIATARWQAFVHAEPALLDAADAPGSPARTVDAQRVAAFVAAHAHVRGPAPVPDVQQVLHAGSGVAELVVREAVPGYDEVDATGTVIDHVDATPPATWRITLVHTDAGWRTQEVSPGR